MSNFIVFTKTTACFYWLSCIFLTIIMLYYGLAAIFYLIFVHQHQKQMQKNELLNNLNDARDMAVRHQRYKLWVAGHTSRIIFVVLCCIDMTLEILTTSIDSDGDVIVNKPASVLTVSCRANAFIRFIDYMLSNFIFTLFSWYKCQLVYTSMPTSIGACMQCWIVFVKIIFWYIVITYPAIIIWGCLKLHSRVWTPPNLCYFYFPVPLFGLSFAHDLMLFVLLLILFMVPLGYQHKRAKRVHTFGSKKQVRHDPPSDAYYCNMSNSPKAMENENEINRDNINNNNNKVYKSLRSQRSVNYVTVTDELQAAMIRNGIGGSCATVAAAFVLIAFYFASCNITHEKYNKRLWTSGFILFANMFRYLVLYVCMTVTYKDWKVMLFPWKCSVRNH
eukprot:960158_1